MEHHGTHTKTPASYSTVQIAPGQSLHASALLEYFHFFGHIWAYRGWRKTHESAGIDAQGKEALNSNCRDDLRA